MSVEIEHRDGAVHLRLNRPQMRNAFTGDMVDSLHQGISAVRGDPSCRVIVIEGAGDNFCAGRDLKSFSQEKSLAELRTGDDKWADIFRMLDECDTPSVSIVRGYAFAGGFTLAMGCDFVLADKSALFQVSEMRHGFPAAINTPVLSKLLGPRLTLEMAMLGETIPAARLYEMGLINRLSDTADELQEQAKAFIATIVSRDAKAIGETKRLNRAVRDGSLSDALNMGSLINTQVSLSGGFVRAGGSLKKSQTTSSA